MRGTLAGVASIFLTFSQGALAQSLNGDEWVNAASNDSTVQLNHVSGKAAAFIISIPPHSAFDQVAEEKARAFESGCPGISQAPAAPSADGLSFIRTVNVKGGARCNFVARLDNGAAVIVAMLVQSDAGPMLLPDFADRVATEITTAALRNAGRASLAHKASTGSQTKAASLPTDNSLSNSTSLKEALASVPKENRPIAIAFRDGTTLMGNQLLLVADAWMIFANGYASDCFDWNPATTAPLPQNELEGCDVVRWRKQGALYEYYDDDDGSWEEGKDWKTVPLTAQMQVAGDWESYAGSFATSNSWGGVSFVRFNLEKISFDDSGRFSEQSFRQMWDRGDSRNSSSGAAGNYMTEGYIIALRKDGVTKLGYMAASTENGKKVDFFWLNGNQYAPQD